MVEPGEDEDLPQPAERRRPRLRRLVPGLLVLAAIVALGAGVVGNPRTGRDNSRTAATRTAATRTAATRTAATRTAATRTAATRTAATRTAATRTAATRTAATRTVDPNVLTIPPSSDVRVLEDPAACAPGGSCNTFDSVPRPVLAAVRAVFPGARPRSATSVLMHRDGPGSHLRFRELNATAGGLDIFVRVREPQRGDDPGTGTNDDGTTRYTFVLAYSHGYTVQVQVHGPVAAAPGVGVVRRLATDSRLLVL